MAKGKESRGKYTRIFHDVTATPAYEALGVTARCIYYELLRQYNGSNNGNLDATLHRMKQRGVASSSDALARGLRELLALGFIVQTRRGGVRQGSKVCCLYALTEIPTNELKSLGVERGPATHGYRLFGSRADAAEAKQNYASRILTIRKTVRDDTENGVVTPLDDTENGVVRPPTRPKNGVVKKPAITRH